MTAEPGSGRGDPGGRVAMVCGMPGAGKTTLAARLAAERDGVHLCADEWLIAQGLDPLDPPLRRRLERHLWGHGLELAGRRMTVVVDFGFWTRPDRRRHLEEARRAGVRAELHVLDVPLDERWRRVSGRNGAPGSVALDRELLASYERWWQPPDAAELALFDPPP